MNIGQCKKKSIEWGRFILVAAIFLFLQQFQLTVCLRPNKTILFMNLKWVLLNMAIVSIPFFTLLCFVRRLNVATILTSILFTLLSLINYHVLAYHGAPFFAEDIFSIGTALNVAGGYKYLVNKNTNITICIFLIEAGLWLILNDKANWFRRKGPGKGTRVCPICGKEFSVNKYSHTKTCSPECGVESAKLSKSRRRASNL